MSKSRMETVEVEVNSRKQAELIQEGLMDKEIKALVITLAALKRIPTKRAQEAILVLVDEYLRQQ